MRAIISVSDKAGVTDFAKSLSQIGFEVFSTGGTRKALAEAGVPVKSVGGAQQAEWCRLNSRRAWVLYSLVPL